jgi:hypothetical protein
MTSITSYGKQALNTLQTAFTPAPKPAAQPQKAAAPAAPAAQKDEFVASEPKAAPVALTVPEPITSSTTQAKSGFNLPGWVTDNPIVNGAQSVVNGVKDFATNVTQAVDVQGNINKLGAGDKYAVGVKVGGGIRGVGSEVKYKTEVEAVPVTDSSGKPVLDTNGQPKLKYTVSMDGEVGAALLGGAQGVDGKAVLGAGGKVEMSFKTPEEAARAVELSMRLPTSGYSNPTPGMDDSTHLTGEELEFLKSNMTAVEMRGTAAAELASELGIAPGLSTTGTLGAGAESSVRVEFNPPAVVTKEQGQVSTQVSGAVGAGGASLGVAGSNGKLTVASEKRYQLPAGTDVNALKSDPAGTVRRVGGAALTPTSEKLTLTHEGEGQVAGNGAGFKHQLVITEGVNEALGAGVVKYAQSGDWSAALRAGGDRVAGEYTLNSFTQHGLSLTPGLKVKGNGFSAEVSALRQDFVYPPVQSQSFTGQQTKKLQEPQASAGQK